MSTDFEWITGDDGHWSAPQPELPPKPTARRWLLLAMVVLLAAGVAVHWQVRQRVEAATTAVVEDARSAYHLYVRAAANHDPELLRSVISGSHPQWVTAQLALLDEGLLLGRWSMGLHPVPETAVPAIVRITPTSDLTEAEVVTQQTFSFVHADGRKEQAALEHTTLFRHGRDRWLAIRPEAEFWGKWYLKHGQQITLIYPQRDAKIADHLLLGLEAELARACRRLQLPCSPDDSYTIRLDTNPASLATVGDPGSMLTQQNVLNLPAPSLVGRPVDITGERALLRGYKAHFITAVIVHHTGWHCCEQGLFHQALIDLQLQQLDLRPWPLQTQHYQEMVRNPVVGVYSLGRYWHEPPTPAAHAFAWPQVYTMLDVLLQEKPELTPFALQQSLVTTDSYRNWINKHIGFVFFNQGRFQRAWLNAVQAHLPPARLVCHPQHKMCCFCAASEFKAHLIYTAIPGPVRPGRWCWQIAGCSFWPGCRKMRGYCCKSSRFWDSRYIPLPGSTAVNRPLLTTRHRQPSSARTPSVQTCCCTSLSLTRTAPYLTWLTWPIVGRRRA